MIGFTDEIRPVPQDSGNSAEENNTRQIAREVGRQHFWVARKKIFLNPDSVLQPL